MIATLVLNNKCLVRPIHVKFITMSGLVDTQVYLSKLREIYLWFSKVQCIQRSFILHVTHVLALFFIKEENTCTNCD